MRTLRTSSISFVISRYNTKKANIEKGVPVVFARKSTAPEQSDFLEDDRIYRNKSSCSMQVGVYQHKRLTTVTTEASKISSFVLDSQKTDLLIEQNKRILRGQEQIKAQNIDIKNTLAVDNTIPPDPEQEGIREEFCIPIGNLRSFDSVNLVVKTDKIKRMKLRLYLSRIGGSQHRVVGNVFKKVMKYSLAAQFCLKGQSDVKTRFDKTEIMDVVVESIRGIRGVRIDENEIKLRIGRWLKAAPEKIGEDDSDED